MSKKPTKTPPRPAASEYTVEQGNTTLVTPGTRAHQDLIPDIVPGCKNGRSDFIDQRQLSTGYLLGFVFLRILLLR